MKNNHKTTIQIGFYEIISTQEVKDTQQSKGQKVRQFKLQVLKSRLPIKCSYFLTSTDRNIAMKMILKTLESI